MHLLLPGRELVKRWYGEALEEVTTFFGPSKSEPPAAIVCASDAGAAPRVCGST